MEKQGLVRILNLQDVSRAFGSFPVSVRGCSVAVLQRMYPHACGDMGAFPVCPCTAPGHGFVMLLIMAAVDGQIHLSPCLITLLGAESGKRCRGGLGEGQFDLCMHLGSVCLGTPRAMLPGIGTGYFTGTGALIAFSSPFLAARASPGCPTPTCGGGPGSVAEAAQAHVGENLKSNV